MKMNEINTTTTYYEIQKIKIEQLESEVKFAELITSSFIPLNMWLVRYLGLDAALFLSAAYEEVIYLRNKGKEVSGHFALTKKKIQSKTGLGAARQKSAIEVLKKHNLIDVCIRNEVPKVREVKINYKEIHTFNEKLNEFVELELKTTKEKKEEFRTRLQNVRREMRKKLHDEQWGLEFMEQDPPAHEPIPVGYDVPYNEFRKNEFKEPKPCYAAPQYEPARSFNGFTF